VAPHLRVLQRKLAEEVTVFVHSAADLEKAIQASGDIVWKCYC
jgi:tyrosyl-tRNA synthetase